jgi:hypothetical protein
MIGFAPILPEITEISIIFLLNDNLLGFHVSHQTTKVYDTREVIDQYHQNHKFKCQPISHYPVIKMSTNMALSGYQNVNEHLTIRLPTCQRTVHYPVIKMSTSTPLSCYQNVNEYSQKLINTNINEATIFTLAVRTEHSVGETTSFHMINLITNMHLIDVLSLQSLYKKLSL